MIGRSEMLFQRFLNLLMTPFAFVPETIHLFVDLLGIILADKVIQLAYLLFCSEV
jgi:hypothetical protein